MSKVVTTDKGTGFCDRWLVRTTAYFSALLLSSAWMVHAQTPSVTLAWDRNSETNLSNYILRYGVTSGGSYTGQVTVAASATTTVVNNLVQGQTYYFIVTARNSAGMESDPSNEANHYVPRPGTNAVPVANAQSVTAAEDTARTITLTGSDADGDPLTFSVVTGPSGGSLSGTAPNLTYTPTANFSGADNFTFRVNDGRTNSGVATVSITVSAVNDTPTLSTINSLTLPTNAGPQNVSLAGIGSGAANESQTLSVTASSSNPSLVPNPTVTYTSPNTTGSLSFTPAANAGGNVTITVTVNDGQAQNNSFSRTFSVTIGGPSAVTLLLEAESGTVTAPMEIASDPDASSGQYVYSQTANLGTVSFNLNLPSAGDYIVWCRNLSTAGNSDSFSVAVDGGAQDIYDTADNTWGPDWQWGQLNGRTAGTPWVLTLSAGAHTLTFQCREALTKLDSFYVTTDRNFTPGTTTPNAAPTLSAISDVTLSEDTGSQTVNLAGITDGSSTENQPLTVTASSSNTGLIPTPAVNYTSPNATGTLAFTPVANVSGTATITVTVNDGQAQNNLATRTFTVTVSAINDVPTLNALNNLSLTEDAGPQTVSLSGISAGVANETQTLSVTASSSNTGLIPTPTVAYTSPNPTGSLSFTPLPNATGTATITVTVNDGQAQNNLFTRTFTVTVGGINDPPTLNTVNNVTVNEDAGAQSVSLTGISAGTGESQTLTVTASSSNTGLIPTPGITYTSPSATGTLSFTPAANASGTASITVTVNDGQSQNNTASRTFTVTVNAVNDSPTLDPINNVSLSEDAGSQTVNLSGITAGANESQTLSVSASSSNTGLVPTPTVSYASPNATGTLSFTPAANATGTATVTVTVNDGQSQNNLFTRTFTVTVSGINDPPTLNTVNNVTVNEDAGAQSVSLTGISAGTGESQTLTVTASSSNTGLIPTPGITYTSPSATGTLSFTPAANASGTASITVTVNDGQSQNNTASRTFTVTVNAVNDSPTLDPINNVSLSEDAGSQTVNLSGITAGANESQTLSVSASSSNTGLVPTPTVSYASPNATGTLSFTPAANATGTATVTVTVNDGQSQNNLFTRTFTVTIGAANDPPTLNPISNVTANEDAAAQSVSLTGIGSGAANETQTLTVTASSSNTGLIPTPGISYNSPNATGTLSFTPVANASGTATLSVTVNDGQAANNTVTRTFTVTINPVNDTPTLNSIANVNISEDAGTQTVNLTGIGSGASDESQPLTVSASSSNTGLIPTPSISYSSPNTTATLSFAPAAEATGTATITVTVNDGQAANNTFSRTFTVTVTGANDPPTLGALSDLNINEDAGPQVVNLAGISTGAANENQSLTITAVSSAPSIVPNPTVSYASPSATGTLTLRPVTNTFGSATITVTVNDGQAQNNTVTRTFNVSVANVNDPPTISDVANQAINEDTSTAAIPFTVADIDTAVGSLTVSGSSSSLSLVPNANIVFGGSGANRTVTVTPAPSVFGSATITIQVSDGNGGSASDSFILTVNGVNQPPTLNPLNPVTLNEDAGPQSVTLTGIGSGAANEIQPLTVTASSSNPSLIAPTVQYTSPNATGVLNFTPAANANGSATISVTVNDGQSANNTVSRTFTVTVNSQNDPPTISDIANQTIAQNAATALLPFTVGDLETAAGSLTVTADSANTTLLPNSGITLGGSGANRTLRLTPALNQYGSAFVTVTVSDGNGGLSSDSLLLVVNAGNLTPTLDPLVALTLAEDGPTQTVGLTGITSGSVNENQSLSVTAVSSDPAIVPHPTVSYASPSSTGSLSLRPLANANGSAVITVTVNDGQSQNNIVTRSFLVSVTSINDAPTLNPLANVALDENAGAQTVPLAGISSGAANENQALTVTAVSSNPSLIPNPTVGYFSPNTTGTLNFTPAANANGTATITVTVDDGQSENNTVVRVFTVSVSGANNPPTITDLPDISIPMNGIASPLNFVVGDAETAPESLAVVVTSSNPALVWTNNITTSGTGSNRVASIRTTVGAAGFSIITFTVYDTDGASASDSFVLTAVPANASPTLDPLSNMILGEDAVVQTIPLTGITSGSPSENQTLIVSAVSSTPSVIPHPTVNYTSPNATGTLVFQPLPNVAGSATIIVTVNDGQSENNVMTRTFGVLVNNVNDPPSISSIPNQIVDQGVATSPIPFVIGDEETPIPSLNVSTASSDTTLVPIGNIVLSGTGANRTVQVTPAQLQSGSATITIFVNDGALTASSSFNVSVGSGNTPPLIVAPASLTTDSYTPLTNVVVRVNDRESRPADLVLSAISYNQTVLPVTNIVFGGAGSNRTVTFKPVPGRSGTVTVSLGVSDGRAVTRTLCQVDVAVGTAPRAKLNVRKRGKGSVEPALDGLDLTLGATYTLTAIPAPGEIFVGWSGGLTSRLAKVSFVMKTNFSLECAFTNSPYPGMKGTYNGLFYEVAGARQESSGNFSLLPTERGVYSGKLKLGSATYSISGQVDLSCKATNLVSRKIGLPLRVELDFGGRSNQVVGRVTDGSWEAPLLGDRAVFSSLSHPAPFAGHYTLVLPGQNDAAQGPQGDGSAMVKIDGNGMVTMAGTLADGTKVSAKMPVSADGQWPLYLPLYSGTGSALSWLTFSPRAGDDVHGLLSWIKGSSLTAKIYPGGFTNECLAMGSVFTAPPKGSVRVLDLSQADLTFGGGDLLVPFTNELVFDALGKIVNLSPNKLSIKLNPASGLISGSVTDPTTAKALKFTGVVFQKQNLGSGFSLGTSHSARFVLRQ